MQPPSPLSKRYRFPGELIRHAVWRSYRCLLSSRDVEALLAERGIAVRDETIRRWCTKCGQTFADGLRRRRPRPGDKGHWDELVLKLTGQRHSLWRAVDQEGLVLDLLVQERRHHEAAEVFLRRLVEGHGSQPRGVVTDKLASDPPAVRRVRPRAAHRRHQGLHNRAAHAHWATRRRARARQRCKSPAHAPQGLAPFGPISDHFRPRRHHRHHLPAPQYHHLLQARFATWREVTGLQAAA